ncbi:hypothetical protein ABT112_20700 [Streptomyces sp. NPDC002055]|uniref:hypothetical protein n=1 Tax=Streptomyces sp. NPDC002055 TaxID=3154534 RepID=UPI00332CC96D
MTTRRGVLPDVVTALTAFLFAGVLCFLVTMSSALPEPMSRVSSSAGAADPSSDPCWDHPETPYGHLPQHRGSRSYGPPTAHPPPQDRRAATAFAQFSGSDFALSHRRATAHAPPHGPPGLRPAARPAVLQVFRL